MPISYLSTYEGSIHYPFNYNTTPHTNTKHFLLMHHSMSFIQYHDLLLKYLNDTLWVNNKLLNLCLAWKLRTKQGYTEFEKNYYVVWLLMNFKLVKYMHFNQFINSNITNIYKHLVFIEWLGG